MPDRIDSSEVYYAPWERTFGRILTPFEEFVHDEAAGSLVLMACALLALFLANGPFAQQYADILHIHIKTDFSWFDIDLTLHHWINDGLMALFFFVVGLEIKREVLLGDLSDLRAASLPILAAVGGMLAPAALYALVNAGGEGMAGWAIPMATDIAFAVGVLALLGSRVPRSLYAFVVALAIVDDMGAVTVIALFYTESIFTQALLMAVAFLILLVVMNLAGLRNPWPALIVACLMWIAMLESGVHATIAGILGAMTVSARPKMHPRRFSQHARQLLDKFDELDSGAPSLVHNQQQRGIVQALENGIHRVESPLQRLEHFFHKPVAFFVIPLFALANAGVLLAFDSLGDSVTRPVTLGIMLGLIAGKIVGVAGVALLAVRIGVGQYPPGCRGAHMVGVGLLCGIGFTMSIFIAELAFRDQAALLVDAKTGILFASLIAGVAGYLWLRAVGGGEADERRDAHAGGR